MTAVRAVFFDLGDTIWHHPDRPAPDMVDAELARRLQGVLSAYGLQPRTSAAEIQRMLAERAATLETRAVVEGGGDYLAMTVAVLREAGLEPSEAQAAAVWETRRLGGRFLRRVILPGAVEMLTTLRQRGYRLGVITNRAHGGDSFRGELEEYGLAACFEAVIASDQVGYRKPHPRIFQVALEALDVTPDQAVHVGDDLRADVHGARDAGILPVWMRGVRPARQNHADDALSAPHVIRHLPELLSLPFLLADPP